MKRQHYIYRGITAVVVMAVILVVGVQSANAMEHHLARAYTYAVTNVTSTSATFNGMVSAEYSGTGQMWFEYGSQYVFNNYPATWPYKSTVKYFPSSGYNTFSTTVTGLKPGTTYHVQLRAENAIGVTTGTTVTFTTPKVRSYSTCSYNCGSNYNAAQVTTNNYSTTNNYTSNNSYTTNNYSYQVQQNVNSTGVQTQVTGSNVVEYGSHYSS